jgi:hypothetical protein
VLGLLFYLCAIKWELEGPGEWMDGSGLNCVHCFGGFYGWWIGRDGIAALLATQLYLFGSSLLP